MNKLRLPNTTAFEERKCAYLLPVKIIKTFGEVKNPENLLKEKKYYQININNDDVTILKNNGGEKTGILLDMGIELQGGVRLLCGSAGGFDGYGQLLLRFGESASEALAPVGFKNAGNDHAAREFYVTVPSMSDQTWGNTGYRFVYMEVTDPGAQVSLKSVLGAFLYRDLEYKGSFRCSDELLNRIFDTSAYTCHLCLQNYLWDGIKRDRLVWLGDSHPEMLTTQAVFGRLKVFEDSVDEARDAYPLPEWINTMPSYSLWWMIILRDQFVYTGDHAYLEANAAYLTGITEQVTACVDENGELHFPSYFIDWPNHNTPSEKGGVKALCVIALKNAAELLRELKNEKLSEQALEAANRLLKAGADCSGSKSTQAAAWFAGFDGNEKTAAVLLNGGAKGVSTFFSYYILSALFGCGKKREALDILRDYYGGMLKMGATSFWEDFNIDWLPGACPIDRLPENGEKDIHGDFGAFCYVNFRHSLCHGWSSGPAPFLIRHILGIRVHTENGKTLVDLQPDLAGLNFASGSCALPDGGVISVEAVNVNGKTQVSFTAPENVTVNC